MPRGRPKKNIPLGVQEKLPEEKVIESQIIDTSAADKSLDDAKGKFTVALTIGLLPDGNIDIATNNPNYAVLNWLLDRAQYELLGHEKQNYLNKGKGA